MSKPWIAALASGIAVVVFIVITAYTGLAAPGALHRYRTADLRALASAIDDEAGPLRTPDDCWRSVHGTDGPLRTIAGVDHVRSRVIVRTYAKNSSDSRVATKNAVIARVDEVISSDPRFSWGMVQIEESPDGWSPLMSCPLVTRGYRAAARS